MSSESVQTALNVPNSGEFVFCSQAAYSPLNNDEEQDAKSQLKIVLDFGAKVTCYNGVLDLICDYLGTANYTAVLGYFDQSNFNSAVSKNWTNPSNGNVAGVFKSAKSLALVQIDGSGHMVTLVLVLFVLYLVFDFKILLFLLTFAHISRLQFQGTFRSARVCVHHVRQRSGFLLAKYVKII